MSIFAERMKEAMELRRIKQADLCRATGIGKSSICTYLAGDYEPKKRNVYKIAKALDVSEEWLMGMDAPMERAPKPSPVQNFVFSATEVFSEKEHPVEAVPLEHVLDIVESYRQQLASGKITLDGEPVSESAIDSLVSAVKIGLAAARDVDRVRREARQKENN